ncbi:MAG: hypothetical protein AAGA87_12510 [Pseudomonadota bacterium]
MTSLHMHPAELAYAFSYSKTVDVVGWGSDPFQPSEVEKEEWYARGAARLLEIERLIDTEEGRRFTEGVTSAVLALADPMVVLLAERKVGDGLRRMTVHLTDDVILGMTRDKSGMFDLVQYADLAAAVAACAGFVGAALDPDQAGARIDTTQEALAGIKAQAASGDTDAAAGSLTALGASPEDAASITRALAKPVAAGMLSILHCSANTTLHAEPYSVLTNAEHQTWAVFPLGSLKGPMVVEHSSVPALTARILVSVAARLRDATA